MATVTRNTFSEETHDWNWHIASEATKLFIGTFPTDLRNRKHDFFYSSSTNRFWEIVTELAKPLDEISNETDEIKKRKLILNKLHLGLTDMGKKVYRQQGSSKDHSLFPVEFMNIIQILNDHPLIDTLIVSGNTQGNSSLNWFSIFCSLNNISFNVKQLEKDRATEINIEGKKFKVVLAYSPSWLSRVTTDKLIEEYRSIILAGS